MLGYPAALGCHQPFLHRPRAYLTGVSLAQIYLIIPAVKAEADRFVGGLVRVEVIDQGHGNASHHAIPLLSAGRLLNQPRVCRVSLSGTGSGHVVRSRRLTLRSPAEQPSD